MKPIPRTFSQLEKQLLNLLQPFLRGEDDLPDFAEAEPGAMLWLVREAWREGPRRDGRSGHLTDEELANAIEERVNAVARTPDDKIKFDRNRYQAVFGKGKKLPDGQRYFQAVSEDVARAFLELALANWEAPPERDASERGQFVGFAPFAGFDRKARETAIRGILKALYVKSKLKVYCRKPLGLGPKGLYRELGEGGYSVVVMGRDESIRMDDPDRQIQDLARMLELLLSEGRGKKENSIHLWAVREPPWDDSSEQVSPKLVRQFRSVSFLSSILDVMQRLNSLGRRGWPSVDLDRCIVAVRSGKKPSKIFTESLPTIWQLQGVDPEPEASIPNFAVNPEGKARFFIFPADHDASAAPFIEVTDPDNGLRDELMSLLAAAREIGHRRIDGWTFHKAGDFIRSRVGHEKEKTQ